MADDEDDSDFEDLFSFSAPTPGGPSSNASSASENDPTQAPHSTGSDYDTLSDVSLHSTTTPAGGAPTAGGSGNVMRTPRSSSGGEGGVADEFDSLFGTPPATPTTARTPAKSMTMTTAEKDKLLAIDESPQQQAAHSMDDFHVHDEDTRDMLDWLDDDNANAATTGGAGSKKAEVKVKSSSEKDDDFDFDQMLAEADDGGNKANAEVVKKQSAAPQEKTNPQNAAVVVDDPTDQPACNLSDESDFNDLTAVAISKSASIEQELNFDQWEDDDDEEENEEESSGEMVDLQIEGSNEAGDNSTTRDTLSSDAKAREGTAGSVTNTASSAGQKQTDGVVSAKTEIMKQSPPQKRIIFTSLSDAIRSNASSAEEVRSLFKKEHGLFNVTGGAGVTKEDRAHLWTKVICSGKVLQDIEDGSLADSYREWEKKHQGEMDAKLSQDGEYGAVLDSLLEQSCGMNKDDANYEGERRQLLSLSYFHSRNKAPQSLTTFRGKKTTTSSLENIIDPLIPPVALAILRAGIPPAAASVVLSHIEPSSMPLLRLTHDEQYLAAKSLHADFYLLACYHLPLLVMHLDRHCPGWYWPRRGNVVDQEKHHEDDKPVVVEENKEITTKPDVEDNKEEATVNDDKKEKGEEEGKEGGEDQKAEDSPPPGAEETKSDKKKKKDLEQNGLVPLSWFITNFAGECGSGSCLDHNNLLPLWDNILTKGDHSWKYFLAIAVLEKNSDLLLMSRWEDLKLGLEKILEFQEADFSAESFIGASEGDAESANDDDMVSEWLTSAKALVESTPSSVIELLRGADDRAVASALKVRQTKVNEELQAQLDADEDARRKEREERDREGDKIENKVRLTAYYRTYNPEKTETDVEKIMKLFDGRMDVLNEKLKNKYGKGFLPEEALKDQTRSFLMSVNQSITETRKHVSEAVSERRKKIRAKSISESDARSHSAVVLEVSTTEVIPVICTTKGHNLATGKKLIPRKRTSDTDTDLRFYLVDCRPESIAAEQGRFPTAVTLSPEKLQEPEELQKMTDMFESLRGAVHICVMGEGFASFPVLYNHTLSKAEQKLLEDDIARTSNCALFFLKKGFPFVSILRGGFAASHAFLSRETDSTGMTPPDVLIEYDPVISLFAQLETARQEEDHYKNAPAREKTARTLQKIIDNSMTRLTIEEHRINSLANDLAKPETVDKMKQSASNFLAKAKPKSVPSIGFGKTSSLFMAKKFGSAESATKTDGESSEAKVEPQAGEGGDKAKSSVTSLTEKMKDFKLPSLHSIGSDTDSGVGEKRKESVSSASAGTSPTLSSAATDTETKDKEKSAESVEGSASEKSTAKFVSGAFTSFTQRMQQQPTRSETVAAPAAESKESKTSEGDAPATTTKENTNAGSKMSFSSFANRMKQATATETKVLEKKEDPANKKTAEGKSPDKENEQEAGSAPSSCIPSKDGGSAGDITSAKVSSAFASFTQRMQKSTTSTVAPASESSQPTSEGGDAAKKEGTMSKMSFASFTSRIKLGQQPDGQQQNQSEKEAQEEAKVISEEMGSSDPEKSQGKEGPKLEESTKEDSAEKNNNEENEPKGESASTENASVGDGGRFTKFTKSIGGSLSGLREKATEVKVSAAAEETQGCIPEKSAEDEVPKTAGASSAESPTAEGAGRFSKFTKSIGGGFSGLRSNQQPPATRPSPFANLYQSKSAQPTPDPTKKDSFRGQGQESEVVESLTNALTSFGKLMLEDEPLPKTRFQRMEAEESISFDDEASTHVATPSSTNSENEGAGELDEEDLFADVSLTDDGGDNEEKSSADTAPSDGVGEEEKAVTSSPADSKEVKQPLDGAP